MEELKNKILELINLLKKEDNQSFVFFEKLLNEIDDNPQEIISSILTSYAITQYANFNFKEEQLFEQIWEIAKKYKIS